MLESDAMNNNSRVNSNGNIDEHFKQIYLHSLIFLTSLNWDDVRTHTLLNEWWVFSFLPLEKLWCRWGEILFSVPKRHLSFRHKNTKPFCADSIQFVVTNGGDLRREKLNWWMRLCRKAFLYSLDSTLNESFWWKDQHPPRIDTRGIGK